MRAFVQLSDCHIDDQPISMGVDTWHHLDQVLDKVKQQEFEQIFISGDLSHQGSEKSYSVLREKLKVLEIEPVVIVGNHDDKHNLSQAFQYTHTNTQLGPWEIIITDSAQMGKTPGRLLAQALTQLQKDLQNSKAEYIIVMLHHPIVSMQSAWDDALSLENPEDLFAILKQHDKVKAVLFGHAHEAKDFEVDGIKIISCPSTALAFNPEQGLGFNHYQLHDNGLVSHKTLWI